MWKNIVEPDRPQKTIWRMCIACWIPNVTKTDTQIMYRGADKSLARPGREQATATEDFDVHIPYLLS